MRKEVVECATLFIDVLFILVIIEFVVFIPHADRPVTPWKVQVVFYKSGSIHFLKPAAGGWYVIFFIQVIIVPVRIGDFTSCGKCSFPQWQRYDKLSGCQAIFTSPTECTSLFS